MLCEKAAGRKAPRLYSMLLGWCLNACLQFCYWRLFADRCSSSLCCPAAAMEPSVSAWVLLELLSPQYQSWKHAAPATGRFLPGECFGSRRRPYLPLQIQALSPLNFVLLVPLFLCLLLSRCFDLRFLRAPLWICLQDWARAGTFEPSSPIILKAAPKRLRVPLQNLFEPTLAICGDHSRLEYVE